MKRYHKILQDQRRFMAISVRFQREHPEMSGDDNNDKLGVKSDKKQVTR